MRISDFEIAVIVKDMMNELQIAQYDVMYRAGKKGNATRVANKLHLMHNKLEDILHEMSERYATELKTKENK